MRRCHEETCKKHERELVEEVQEDEPAEETMKRRATRSPPSS